MPYAVEMTLDPTSAHSGARPHVSLGIWPGTWVPHCTLATDMEPDQFGTALAIAGRVSLPLECRVGEVGIVEFRPVKQLVSRVLGGP